MINAVLIGHGGFLPDAHSPAGVTPAAEFIAAQEKEGCPA